MAKALGIIGNIKGKVGNVVGYNLTDSNNKQTQGLRVYQPNVKNPKTAAQAEQRAKLAPINATYRALKMIIDRGNEGLPYGNKSRLAWLKSAFMASQMPWFEKGAIVSAPVGCQLTKGSLSGFYYAVSDNEVHINCAGVTEETSVATIGAVSTLLIAAYPSLKNGDQITLVAVENDSHGMLTAVDSFIVDTTSNEANSLLRAGNGMLNFDLVLSLNMGAVIVSREGANGEHLRSTAYLAIDSDIAIEPPYNAASKTAAVASYMASGSANTDWAEESIQ